MFTQPRILTKHIRSIFLVAIITVMLLEIVLRFFFHGLLFIPDTNTSPEHQFWQHSAVVGWEPVPNASGNFSNGAYDGAVTYDEHGIRKNSQNGTRAENYENIFFIGDSTTASLEVDDNETVPAVLEQLLRRDGHEVNVINLGVRGYGTDQSVLRAKAYASRYKPAQIIYMYTDNDVFNNNTIKRPYRKYGKGVYIHEAVSPTYEPARFPVPKYGSTYAGLVVLDSDCRPIIYELDHQPDKLNQSTNAQSSPVKRLLTEFSYTYRALRYIRNRLAPNPEQDSAGSDPYQLAIKQGVKWSDDFLYAYMNGGSLRSRCRTYFEDQIRFLLNQLLAIESVRAIHMVQFPTNNTVKLLRDKRLSVNNDFFSSLLAEGTVDSYINLPQAMVDAGTSQRDYQCPGDTHFCERGNAWIAKEIFSSLRDSGGKGRRP